MPSGRVHDRITYLATGPVAIGVKLYTHSLPLALAASAGLLFGGLMFGPDLDTRSVQYRRWGFARWIWWPYQRLFSHRSPWTHGLFLGLLVRLGYFSLVILLVASLMIACINTYDRPIPWQHFLRLGLGEVHHLNRSDLVWSMGGVWLGGALHSWADVVHTFVKRRRRSKCGHRTRH